MTETYRSWLRVPPHMQPPRLGTTTWSGALRRDTAHTPPPRGPTASQAAAPPTMVYTNPLAFGDLSHESPRR